ncbi:RagB/SusD family nutrient uptake outer membrane protein [Mucilaginibacter sp. BJC16-A38]|uniref:RagB/SusD family nutrient uptake outer membrane protein n=1 Tax=Mucilaginibacter phenanthrenivorans TaxID=1234842 RepID=UPI0021574649|nr:RagB/SusD family nutrient uptake outer membrane protein [Mucilaginibacter phenanthrenivorans]MCR8556989.1 RagB/SusD family nutrient uptake outer membrane protein [Mucilaginibacter phenanthrenivorans]
MKKYFIKNILPVFILLALTGGGCKKLAEVNPPVTSLSGANVFTDDASAASVLTGIYGLMSSSNTNAVGNFTSLTLYGGLSSDELTYANGLTNTTAIAYYRNALGSKPGLSNYGAEFWQNLYLPIFKCNDAIIQLNASSSLTPAIKQQLLGEAKFIRAFFYFYLVNLYGDVPLALTNDYKINSVLARSPKAQVYQQIIADLKDAQSLLSTNYLDATLMQSYPERVRPTKWAATALLARTYLYYGNLTGDAANYSNAETQATTLINNSGLFSLSAINNTFLKYSLGNPEAIWQLQPVNANINSYDAYVFIITSTGLGKSFNFGAYASNYLLNSFEAGDQRKNKWLSNFTISGTTYYFPYKYKVAPNISAVTEFPTLLRLGEQYLIRAEARAQLGEANAADDLNAIRNRAGLSNYAGATDKTSLLTVILHEREVELFAEFGHRWFDLKRTGNVDAVMGAGGVCAAKGGTWSINWQWYPVLYSDIQNDPNLKQNPGY